MSKTSAGCGMIPSIDFAIVDLFDDDLSTAWLLKLAGDSIRKVHVNTAEGMWATVRNFRPFRGVHKKYLSGYVAMCESGINLKRVTPAFISALH